MSESPQEQKTSLPLYQDPHPVSHDRHAEAGVNSTDGYAHTSNESSVVLNANEFVMAAKYYPIVFAGQAPYLPLAVLSLNPGENNFVSADGAWKEDYYIPAYIRRFPYALMQGQDGNLILAVDEGAKAFAKTNPERAFFDGDEPSDYTKKVMEFCQSYQQNHMATRQLSQQLFDAGVLVSREVTIKKEDGTEQKAGGFMAVDDQKLNQLNEATVFALHQSGALSLAHFHLLSMSNWQALAAAGDASAEKQAA